MIDQILTTQLYFKTFNNLYEYTLDKSLKIINIKLQYSNPMNKFADSPTG